MRLMAAIVGKCLITLVSVAALMPLCAQERGNTITRDEFNFGHQLGYMYSRMGDAYLGNARFGEAGTWSFRTGFLAFHTPEMPLVRNPHWRERTILMVPLYFRINACRRLAIDIELTDLFVEFPYENIHNMGGKSPRFKTTMGLLEERDFLPAVAFTVGVKFSSAKPYTIWDNEHNYDESNGLAGAGTGVADYLLLFTLSKRLSTATAVHARLGLAPIGSPVEYKRGSAQADEIPYGVAVEREIGRWAVKGEVGGMYPGLSSTHLAHYSMARLQLSRRFANHTIILNLERGLTEESDTWVAGFYEEVSFGKGNHGDR